MIVGGSQPIAGFLAGAMTAMTVTNGAARLMTNPKFVDWLAAATRMNMGSLPGHVARLEAIARTTDVQTQEAIMDFVEALGDFTPRGDN